MGLENTGTNRRRARQNYRQKVHVAEGFPHFTTAWPHHCICLEECCQDMRPEVGTGCVCKGCPCQVGATHGAYAKTEIAQLEGSTS